MHYIKNIPHYAYSMYYDVINYKFVRKKFLSMIGFIVLGWIVSYIMLMGLDSSRENLHVSPLFVPIMMTVGFTVSWIIGYYTSIYPMISKWHEEWQLQEKYPYLYNKFIERE